MSRRKLRERATASTELAVDNKGHLAGERFAQTRITCAKCSNQLMIFARHMDGQYDHGLEHHLNSVGGVMYPAGPDTDPYSRYAFDCGKCGRRDIIVRTDRIASATEDLLATCHADDTPRTRDLVV